MIEIIKFLTHIIECKIYANWSKLSIPEAESICTEDSNSLFIDVVEIRDWLAGKTFECIIGSNDAESLMPFYYFSDQSKVYYIAGYLLELTRILQSDLKNISSSFAFDHVLDHLCISKSFDTLNLMTEDQKLTTKSVFELILILNNKINLSDDDINKINYLLHCGE